MRGPFLYVPVRPRYRVLAIGVNAPRGSKPLAYAEADAETMARFLTSAAVPVSRPSDASVLLGRDATVTRVLAELDRICRERPMQFVLVLDGHGAETGFAVHDGLLEYRVLRDKLRCIGAERSLVLLDTCHAGAALPLFEKGSPVVGGLGGTPSAEAAWMQLLARSTPSTRLMAATGRQGRAGEGRIADLGNFTACVLESATYVEPDLHFGGFAYASDSRVFAGAAKRLLHHTNGAQRAVYLGSRVAMPFCVPERAAQLGIATVRNTLPWQQIGLSCDVDVHDRRQLPVRVTVRLASQLGAEEVVHDEWFEPGGDAWRHHIDIDASDFGSDEIHQAIWYRFRQGIALTWTVLVTDTVGRLLGSRQVPFVSFA
jgi:hypothetical protein